MRSRPSGSLPCSGTLCSTKPRPGSTPVLASSAPAPELIVTPNPTDLPVLIAEDNLINQRLVTKFLERLGYACHVVGDGQGALDALSTQAFSCVLMDCSMPVLDGYQATIQLRKREQGGAIPRTPVIALTANAFREDRERCLAVGMDDFLPKPVKLPHLREVLERWTQASDDLAEAG